MVILGGTLRNSLRRAPLNINSNVISSTLTHTRTHAFTHTHANAKSVCPTGGTTPTLAPSLIHLERDCSPHCARTRSGRVPVTPHTCKKVHFYSRNAHHRRCSRTYNSPLVYFKTSKAVAGFLLRADADARARSTGSIALRAGRAGRVHSGAATAPVDSEEKSPSRRQLTLNYSQLKEINVPERARLVGRTKNLHGKRRCGCGRRAPLLRRPKCGSVHVGRRRRQCRTAVPWRCNL